MRRNFIMHGVGRLWLALALLVGAQSAQAIERGYIELDDGIGLRYAINLPEGNGPFPVLLQYQGYGAGSDPDDNGISLVSARWLELGFAVLGVSLRGTGCSEGDFDLFETQWVDDGRQVLDWIVQQPWSNGAVAMVGLSFPGMTQMMVGPSRHPALKALMPWSAMTDLYRDVAYPGGIFNLSFAAGWTGLQKSGYQYLLDEIGAGNLRCLPAVARHNDLERIVVVFGQTHPYAEHFVYERFVPEGSIAKISVPTLVSHAWQDEQISSRTSVDYEQLDPALTWHVYGNGVHGYGLGSPTVVATAEAFLRHFLLGEDNGFERTPRVQIEREVAFGAEPRWVDRFDRWPVETRNAELYLTPAGTLDAQRPDSEAAFPYIYPLPAPSMTAAVAASTENQTYALPVPPGGAVLFTSAPLAHDLDLFGPSRVDLWLSSTATDTDVQISLTEVRPDGQEMFVQRGWLRASHRAMDLRENRATMPHHWFSESAQLPLTAGEPTPLSIEVWPVAHLFRTGSSLRLRVEAPLGTTGFRQLELNPLPAVNTVHTGGTTMSRITLPLRPGATAPLDYPPCTVQANQPCRNSDANQPTGTLQIPAANAAAPTIAGRISRDVNTITLTNSSAEPHYPRAISVRLDDADDLDSVSLWIDDTQIRIDAPHEMTRFELPERLLEPGASLSYRLAGERKALAMTTAFVNAAHAAGAPLAAGALTLPVWLLMLACGGPLRRQRAWIGMLLISGVLVACGGSTTPSTSGGGSSPPGVVSAEVVDARGSFVVYATP